MASAERHATAIGGSFGIVHVVVGEFWRTCLSLGMMREG